jgi:GT2 family glycosyltransferase
MGCNVSISKGDFIRVNGFDEEFEGWGQEDDDIAWRLQRLGVRQARLRYAGLALHLWHPSRQTEAGEGQSNLRLLNSRRAAGRVWCQRGLAGHQVFRRHVRPAGAVELTSRLQRYRAP